MACGRFGFETDQVAAGSQFLHQLIVGAQAAHARALVETDGSGGDVGGQHQAVIFRDPGGGQGFVVLQLTPEGLAVQPVVHRAPIRADGGQLQQGGQFGQQVVHADIIGDFGSARSAAGQDNGYIQIRHDVSSMESIKRCNEAPGRRR